MVPILAIDIDMKMHSSDWIRHGLLRDLLFLYPDRNKRTFFVMGNPGTSETLRNGHCIIRSTPDIFKDFERLGLVSVSYLNDKERVEIGLNEYSNEIVSRNVKKIKITLVELRSKHNITVDLGDELNSCPSGWSWQDRNSGKYQFGIEGIIKVGGKKHGKASFQVMMDEFETMGIIHVDTIFKAGKFRNKREARGFINFLNSRRDFKSRGLSFVAFGKGYYNIYYSPLPNL